MKQEEFRQDGWVDIVRGLEGFDACVPRDLPPAIMYDATLAAALSAAERGLGQLSGIVRTLPNPRLLMATFLRREAVLSSRIEGTRASLSDLFLFEMKPEVENEVPDVREVSNYVRAVDHGLARLRKIPLSLNLILELHGILMDGVRGADKSPGQFRKRQNWIGGYASTRIEDATYVPPPRERLLPLLDAFEKFLNSPSEIPLSIRLAMIHYQFEAIHPFEDGNGRVGRLIISLMLQSERVLPYPVLYLSAFFERYQDDYYKHLLRVSQRGTWNEWLHFFLRGVSEQSIDAVERSNMLSDLRVRWANECQTARTTALLIKMIDNLFMNPYITCAKAAADLGVGAQSAQNNIDQLIEKGILLEITGQRRNRVYAALEIVRVLDQTPTLSESQGTEV